MITSIRRGKSEIAWKFSPMGLEFCGIHNNQVELEVQIPLFPYGFHESLKKAVTEGATTYPRLSLPFGKEIRFTLERQGGTVNGEVWFTFKTNSPGFFAISLREKEIANLLAHMREYMTC